MDSQLTTHPCLSCLGVLVSMEVYKWRHHRPATADSDDQEMRDKEKVERFLASGQPAVRRSPRHTPATSGDSELKKRNVKLPP